MDKIVNYKILEFRDILLSTKYTQNAIIIFGRTLSLKIAKRMYIKDEDTLPEGVDCDFTFNYSFIA